MATTHHTSHTPMGTEWRPTSTYHNMPWRDEEERRHHQYWNCMKGRNPHTFYRPATNREQPTRGHVQGHAALQRNVNKPPTTHDDSPTTHTHTHPHSYLIIWMCVNLFRVKLKLQANVITANPAQSREISEVLECANEFVHPANHRQASDWWMGMDGWRRLRRGGCVLGQDFVRFPFVPPLCLLCQFFADKWRINSFIVLWWWGYEWQRHYPQLHRRRGFGFWEVWVGGY